MPTVVSATPEPISSVARAGRFWCYHRMPVRLLRPPPLHRPLRRHPALAPEPVVASAPTLPPPAPVPTPEPTRPTVDVAIPTDPLARERELERLLTRANVERARALIRDSRKTLEQALALAPHVSPTAAAPVYEQLGDLLAAEERLPEAKEHYEKALELSGGKRASAEKKLGEVTVRLSDQEAMVRLGGVLAPSDDLVDVLRSPTLGQAPRRSGNGSLAGARLWAVLLWPDCQGGRAPWRLCGLGFYRHAHARPRCPL